MRRLLHSPLLLAALGAGDALALDVLAVRGGTVTGSWPPLTAAEIPEPEASSRPHPITMSAADTPASSAALRIMSPSSADPARRARARAGRSCSSP